MMDKNEKTCKNCKYFLQYYIIRKTKIAGINCGYCLKHKSIKTKQDFPINNHCDAWDSDEQKKKGINLSVQASLSDIADRLNNIILIIKSMQDNQI